MSDYKARKILETPLPADVSLHARCAENFRRVGLGLIDKLVNDVTQEINAKRYEAIRWARNSTAGREAHAQYILWCLGANDERADGYADALVEMMNSDTPQEGVMPDEPTKPCPECGKKMIPNPETINEVWMCLSRECPARVLPSSGSPVSRWRAVNGEDDA